MTDDGLPLAELMRKAGGDDFLRAVAEAVVRLLVENDVDGLIGAGRHERTAERARYRDGYRDRALDTRPGTSRSRIPKPRGGPAYFPPFPEARETSGRASVAVIQEAWSGGVSTRRVDDLVRAMGPSGIGKSTVSKLCKGIDELGRSPCFAHGERLPRPPAIAKRSVPEGAERRRAFRGASGRTCGWTRPS